MMDSSKAKKAKSKAKSRKSATNEAMNQAAMLNQMAMQDAAMQGSALNPEVQVPVASMQNQTAMVNPYGRMGTVAPNLYNPGNIVY